MSVPCLRYGPNRPLWATISSPVSGSVPDDPRDAAAAASACSRVSVAGAMDANSDAVRGLSPPSATSPELDVGAEAPGLDLHGEPALGVGAEHPVVDGAAEELLGPLDGQLVGRQVVGDGGPVLAALEVGPVAADPGHDRPRRRRPSPSGIELISRASISPRWVATVALSPTRRRAVVAVGPLPSAAPAPTAVAAEVEAGQPGQRLLAARGDLVEVVLHRGGEAVVDQVGEVALEQPDHGEGGEATGTSAVPFFHT